VTGQRLLSGWIIPVIITSTLSAVFILIAIWRFSREEF
jgi:hypothetical protein